MKPLRCPHCNSRPFGVIVQDVVKPYYYQIECGEMKTTKCKIVTASTKREVIRKWQTQKKRKVKK